MTQEGLRVLKNFLACRQACSGILLFGLEALGADKAVFRKHRVEESFSAPSLFSVLHTAAEVGSSEERTCVSVFVSHMHKATVHPPCFP
jgi:hypothetical protein